MVAAHTWDTIGAQGAGMRSALITRPGNAALTASGVRQPSAITTSITDLAIQLRHESFGAISGGRPSSRSRQVP